MPKPAKSKNPSADQYEQPITSDNLEDHRQQILKRARSLVRPLGLSRKKFLSLTATIVAGSLIVFLIVFGVLIYRFKNDSNLTYRVSQVIPYPVSSINGRFVSYGDYLFELNYQKNAVLRTQNLENAQSSNQAEYDFSTDEGKKLLERLRTTALDQTRQKALVRQLADENNVSVSNQELDEEVNRAISEGGGQDKFQEAISYFYDWNINDFKRAMHDLMLKRKLQPVFSQQQRQRAERLLERVNSGSDFSKLAKQHSEDTGSKKKGGNLGFSSRGAYVKEFEDVAYSLEVGKVSGIVETQFGFHIIKVVDKKEDQVKVAHILIRYEDIEKVIQDKLKAAKIRNFVNIQAVQQPQPDVKAQ